MFHSVGPEYSVYYALLAYAVYHTALILTKKKKKKDQIQIVAANVSPVQLGQSL